MLCKVTDDDDDKHDEMMTTMNFKPRCCMEHMPDVTKSSWPHTIPNTPFEVTMVTKVSPTFIACVHAQIGFITGDLQSKCNGFSYQSGSQVSQSVMIK